MSQPILPEHLHTWLDIFPAKLTAKSGSSPILFSWTEQICDGVSGNYSDALPARQGDSTNNSAQELTNTDVDVTGNPVVWMRVRGSYGDGFVYEFRAPASTGGVTVTDGTNSFSGSTITVAPGPTGGAVIVSAGPTITLQSATATNSGIVTTADQTWAGSKVVNDEVICLGTLQVGGDATFANQNGLLFAPNGIGAPNSIGPGSNFTGSLYPWCLGPDAAYIWSTTGVEFAYITASSKFRQSICATGETSGVAVYAVRDKAGSYHEGISTTTGGLTITGGIVTSGTITATGTVTSVATSGSITGGTITTTGTLSLVNDSASPGNSQYYGTDGSGTKGFFALPAGPGTVGAFPQWVKITKSYTDFSTAGTSNTITIYTLPAGGVVHAVKAKHATQFSGGTIATYLLSTIDGTSNTYASLALNMDTAPADTNGKMEFTTAGSALTIEAQGSTTAITATVMSSGDTLNHATQGSVDIWLLLSVAV